MPACSYLLEKVVCLSDDSYVFEKTFLDVWPDWDASTVDTYLLVEPRSPSCVFGDCVIGE